MNDKKVPNHYQLSDIQKSKNRKIPIVHVYSFVFSTDIKDWIMIRKRRQELKYRDKPKDNKKNEKQK